MRKLFHTIDELEIKGTLEERTEFDKFKDHVKRTIKEMEHDVQKELKKLHRHYENIIKHNVMVAYDVKYIANKLNIPSDEVQTLFIAALLHDIGKLDVFDILLTVSQKEEQNMLEIKRKENPHDMTLMRKDITPVEALTVWDFLRYKKMMHKDFDIKFYMFYIKERKIPIKWKLREYLNYHQKRTGDILKSLNLDKKIVEYAASHHPEYFVDQTKLNWKCYIIAIADKFNAIIQSEGIRTYNTKKNRILALDIIIESLQKKFANSIFKRGRKKIIRILGQKYIPYEVEHFIIPYSKSIIDAIRKGKQLDENTLEEIEKLIIDIEKTFEVNKKVTYILDDNIVSQLKNIEYKLEKITKEKLKAA